MQLNELLSPWVQITLPKCEILGLQQDSRNVQPGDLFFAYNGHNNDGRKYIDAAIAQGAIAIIYDPLNADLKSNFTVPTIAIPKLSHILPAIANRFYNEPSKSLYITGITGTNGKTTIAHQLAEAHYLLGQRSAYIGTLGHGEIQTLQALDNTTPGALLLQKLLYQYQQDKVKQVCMEVSSHALHQDRVAYVNFKQAIYTNLTQDHLDYHKSMQHYALAKAKLFQCNTLEWAIINQDDNFAQLMLDQCLPYTHKLTYGIKTNAQLKAFDIKLHHQGTDVKVASPWGVHKLSLTMPGLFNVYNSLAIFGSLLANGYTNSLAESVMCKLHAAPGRMQIVKQQPLVVIDYAHTPDALDKVLHTLMHVKQNSTKQGKLIVVFGCGGNRDSGKRPLMGAVACKYADQIILTSDNPRHEAPEKIIEDIAAGISAEVVLTCNTDRQSAIHFALQQARNQDIVLIAGKGHEKYQDFGDYRIDFSDQKIVENFH